MPRPVKGQLQADPRGLLWEAYRMDGLEAADCRTIFLDWMLGAGPGDDPAAAIRAALAEYAGSHPDHPMTRVLREGLERPQTQGRRGGRRGRAGG